MMHLLPDEIILKIIDMTGGFSKLKHKEKFSSTLNYINSIQNKYNKSLDTRKKQLEEEKVLYPSCDSDGEEYPSYENDELSPLYMDADGYEIFTPRHIEWTTREWGEGTYIDPDDGEVMNTIGWQMITHERIIPFIKWKRPAILWEYMRDEEDKRLDSKSPFVREAK